MSGLADTIVPQPGNPQSLNRYSYVGNNPLRYTDPTGYAQTCAEGDEGGGCGRGATYAEIYEYFRQADSPLFEYYALLAKLNQALLAGASAVEIESLQGSVEAAYQRGSWWVPQASFDPWMAAVDPGSAYRFGAALTSGAVGAVTRFIGNTATSGTTDSAATAGAEVRRRSTALFPYYPPNDGFAERPIRTILEPGTIIDRYGAPSGRYASPQGTPLMLRSLPPGTEKPPLTAYEVIKSLEVDAGKVAPWFNRPGGGTQYHLGHSVQTLIDLGYLRPLP